MESYIFSSDFLNFKYVINVNTLCTTFNAEPNRYTDTSIENKRDVPTWAVYFTNEFLIVIQIR